MSDTLLGNYDFEQKNLEDLSGSFESIVQKILAMKGPTFLLPSLLKSSISLSEFEFWMNQFLSLEEQLEVRGKIIGKSIPRDAYQLFFPIGMDKYYPGTHFVSAHLAPDLDTTVASFIGWLDAFGAKVGLGLHLWSLPGGPADPSITQLFEKLWGKGVFSIARSAPTLTLGAMDLTTREGMEEVSGAVPLMATEKALIFVNEEGKFLGDWHSRDAEKVRPVIILFKALLRKFESLFYVRILRFFADPEAALEKWVKVYDETFGTPLENDLFLEKILEVKNPTFTGVIDAFQKLGYSQFHAFQSLVKSLHSIFDSNGRLKEDRSLIFQTIENLIRHLNLAIEECNQFAELLSTAIKLKSCTTFLTLNSTMEEIRTKMENRDYLTVLSEDRPVGIIQRNALSRYPLGTVSLRDFSNFDEVHMASYLNAISVIDHHKSALATTTPPLIIVGDVQSCNTLVAEQLFILNEKYSDHIHSDREIAEYFSCLYAIIDDTDFLSKVSARDIDCVATLLNSLKIRIYQKPCIDLSDIPRDQNFIHASRSRILKSPDMFSLYDKIIESRQTRTEEALESFDFDALTSDTKDQNGCARIGQTKLFPINFPLYKKKKGHFSAEWRKKAQGFYQMQNDLALHLQMISTIPSAEDLFSGIVGNYTHLDELWIWIPKDSSHAEALLATFLNSLLESPKIREKVVKIEVQTESLKQIFQRNFLPLPVEIRSEMENLAVIYVKAGTLNSRKSMVSPYLPITRPQLRPGQ